jgi:hypothetical protein
MLVVVSALTSACYGNTAHTEQGDTPADAGTPSPLGTGLRIAEINAFDSSVRPIANQLNVNVTGATFIIKDEFAETGLASSVGSIYVQDFHANVDDAGATPPYSGMDLYKTTYQPASLALAPGDVIDFVGEYQQYEGPSSFPFAGQYQPEFYEAIATFRFDYSAPQGTPIDWRDLNAWSTGYKWMSMLVTVGSIGPALVGGGQTGDGTGRCKVFFTPEMGESALAIDNELYNFNNSGTGLNNCNDASSVYALMPGAVGNVHFKSITGVVTYFGSFTISPRSDADIVLE